MGIPESPRGDFLPVFFFSVRVCLGTSLLLCVFFFFYFLLCSPFLCRAVLRSSCSVLAESDIPCHVPLSSLICTLPMKVPGASPSSTSLNVASSSNQGHSATLTLAAGGNTGYPLIKVKFENSPGRIVDTDQEFWTIQENSNFLSLNTYNFFT